MEKYRFDEDFDLFLEDIGEYHDNKKINETLMEDYKNKLPQQLFLYWKELGTCGFGDGLFWMVNPKEYESILNNWLIGTVFEHRDDLSVIARTAFGELYIWAKNKGEILVINPLISLITYNATSDKENNYDEEDENDDMRSFWGFTTVEACDYDDENDKPMFAKSLKKFGVLKEDEMYGYKLSPSLGGDELFSNITVQKLHVYHDIARQMQEPDVIVIN